MGLRSSSLAKKNDENLTWVLHKKEPFHSKSSQKPRENENANILVRRSYADSTPSEYRGRRYNNHVQRKMRNHVHSNILDYGKTEQTFGYGITDLDDFLSKASIGRPGNIPMVLCTGCLLYQTQLDDHYQTEVALPLGVVVNAVFKNEQWLYVQTPHAEEGYIPYGSCLPLGIAPPPDAARAPCWETQSDVFPRPVGDRRRHRQRRHQSGQHVRRGRSSGARSSVGSDDAAATAAADGAPHCGDDAAAPPYRRRQRCSSGPADGRPSAAAADAVVRDGRPLRWRWVDGGGRGTSAAADRSITGYGYL